MHAASGRQDAIAGTLPERAAPIVRIEGTGRAFPCGANETVLSAALRAGVGFPYECGSGGCGSCKFDLVAGELLPLWPDAPGLKPREFARGKRLACQARATGPCAIRLREDPAYVPAIRPIRQVARLAERRALTPDLCEFAFVAEVPAEFLPGQYALLHVPGVPAPRAYSMSNLANREGRFEFCIKRVPGGAATSALFDRMAAGDTITIDAPYSIAHLRPESPRDIVCVAGGSGLAPMLSILRGALQAPALQARTIHLFYGGREPADIVPLERLGFPASVVHRLHFVPVISEGKSEAAARWSGARGFVHQALAAILGADAAMFEYYLAGPPPMVEAVRRILILEKSVAIEQVHYDRFF
jgi:toluene monooxygenase electron transfer component